MTKKIKISKWDRNLFTYLHENKIATLEQIIRDLPHYKSRSSYIWRLWKLKKHSYINGVYNEKHNGINIYKMTRKAYKEFISKDLDVGFTIGSNSVFHDLTLVDLKSKILNSKSIRRYYTENMIQAWEDENYKVLEPFKTYNTDAAINVKIAGKNYWFGIEYERSTKGAKRYKELFSTYYLNKDITAVFYICESQSVITKLQQLEKEVIGDGKKKLFFTIKDSILVENDLKFKNYDGITIDLNAD